jgi:hypothetical protein
MKHPLSILLLFSLMVESQVLRPFKAIVYKGMRVGASENVSQFQLYISDVHERED